jgi:hypothetical protein
VTAPINYREGNMMSQERTCGTCGHRCHCYQPECEESIGVGMTDKYQRCGCKNCDCKKDIPNSFTRRN